MGAEEGAARAGSAERRRALAGQDRRGVRLRARRDDCSSPVPKRRRHPALRRERALRRPGRSMHYDLWHRRTRTSSWMSRLQSGKHRTVARRTRTRVYCRAELGDISSRNRDEGLNLDFSALIRVPARIHPVQFDHVTLGSDGHPHQVTIGSKQNRLNSDSTLVSNRH
jgi:hypothetical protein